MNLEKLDVWVRIIQGVGTFGVWIYVWWTNRKYKSDARFVKVEKSILETEKSVLETKETIEKRLDAHGERLSGVEAACKHAPGHEELGNVYTRVNGISEQVSGLLKGQETLQRSVEMIHEHLLNRSGGPANGG